jgi:isopentenyl-diphosphate delta-isomerase
MAGEDEWLDLVDASDAVVGRMLRSEVYARGLSNFRVVNAFIVNEKAELWIPRRARHKRLFPGALDVSVGGHVESGEDYDAAFARETMEEVRIDVRVIGFREIARLSPVTHSVSAFMRVYAIHHNADPEFNRDDFTEAFWLSPNALLDRIADGEPCKGDLPELVRQVQRAFRSSIA